MKPALLELDPAALREDVETFAALGPRFCGSEGEERARELLLEEFAAAGLTGVGGEEYRYLAYEPGRCECRAGGAELPCVGLQSCAAGTAEAEAVYVGAGEEDDLATLAAAGAELRGRIAVLRSAMPAAVAADLVARGATGLVLLSPTPDGLVGHFTASFYPPPPGPPWEGRVLPVPGVTVEAAAGERLLALLSAGPARVWIEHRAEYRERTAVNVVGEIAGVREPGERVLLGAHYDTQLESPGAADNGSGLAALLAIARAWAGARPRRTVAFAAFAGEELACWGASAYVRAHAGELPLAMVNLDALGPPLLAKRTIVASPAIAAHAAAAAAASGWEVEVEVAAGDFPYSDLAPFAEAGVHGCQAWRYPPPHPYYHSAGDTPRWVDYDLLAADARAAASIAFSLVEAGVAPAAAPALDDDPERRIGNAA
ncbi:MAG: M20/M25/M40 family metallo-hydrolase [Actinobacteria bacterium]|nr:M20/M25/M40 family metallo-hydrolase [Actinomycetota bacterium]